MRSAAEKSIEKLENYSNSLRIDLVVIADSALPINIFVANLQSYLRKALTSQTMLEMTARTPDATTTFPRLPGTSCNDVLCVREYARCQRTLSSERSFPLSRNAPSPQTLHDRLDVHLIESYESEQNTFQTGRDLLMCNFHSPDLASAVQTDSTAAQADSPPPITRKTSVRIVSSFKNAGRRP